MTELPPVPEPCPAAPAAPAPRPADPPPEEFPVEWVLVPERRPAPESGALREHDAI